MAKGYDPAPHLRRKATSEFHPAANVLKRPARELNLGVIDRYLQDAFLPSHESQPAAGIEALIAMSTAKCGGVMRTLENFMPESPRDSLAILDLAAGSAPFLCALIKQHGLTECGSGYCVQFRQEVAPRVRYIGVDRAFHPVHLELLQGACERLECFEFVAESVDLTRPGQLDRLAALAGDSGFDMVILSNALHELPPETWPDLLAAIPDLLHPKGEFILLDLTNPVDRTDTEAVYESLRKCESYWEAAAVYCTRSMAVGLIKAMDMNRTVGFGHDDERPYWCVKATKGRRIRSADWRRTQVLGYLREALPQSIAARRATLRDERQSVHEAFEKSSDPDQRLFRALKYFSQCGSHSRLRECLPKLRLKERVSPARD